LTTEKSPLNFNEFVYLAEKPHVTNKFPCRSKSDNVPL
jgi:hypothetical protein